jgi:thymidylate kinase
MNAKTPHQRTQLIVIDGPDRVGKETQSKMLTEHLRARGYKVALIEVPYHDGLTYNVIYWMLRNGLAKQWKNTFQAVHFLNKWVFQTFALKRLEWDYDFVIMDRWQLSSEVYGEATGIDQHANDFLGQFLTRVDVTFVLLGPAWAKEGRDVYEKDKKLQDEVRRLYKEKASQDASLVEIAANQSAQDVHDIITGYLLLTKRITE